MSKENPTKVGDQLVERDEKGRVKKGSVLNPIGTKPGTRHFETLFRDAVKRIALGEEESDDILIVKKVVEKAKAGDLKATEIVLDRTDGKVAQPIAGADGGAFIISLIKYEDDNDTPQPATE